MAYIIWNHDPWALCFTDWKIVVYVIKTFEDVDVNTHSCFQLILSPSTHSQNINIGLLFTHATNNKSTTVFLYLRPASLPSIFPVNAVASSRFFLNICTIPTPNVFFLSMSSIASISINTLCWILSNAFTQSRKETYFVLVSIPQQEYSIAFFSCL